MLSIILFLLVISAFAIFASFRLDKTFEETIAISCMGIVLVLFLFGMVNLLKFGTVVVCIVALELYVYTIYWVVKNGARQTFKTKIFNLITPGSVVFAVFSILLAYWNQDRLATRPDEFSHWLDTVVIMSQIDKFGTAPGSTAVFPSYPPAMSLFQYLLEKLNMLCTGAFSEWKTYYAYQLLAIVIMLPFIKVKGKNIYEKIASILLWFPAVVMPLYFFSEAYCSLYIDPFLGVMGGCGFATISLTKNKDWLYNTYISMLCATLTLAKDVGIYLALFIALYFAIDKISTEKVKVADKNIKGVLQFSCLSLSPIVSIIVAKLLWKIELIVTDTYQKFSAPFDIAGTINTISGNGDEFQTTVFENFKAAITYRYVYFERMGFNYTAIMILMAAVLIVIHVKLYKRNSMGKVSSIAGAVTPSIAIIFYILSMFPLYISRFSEQEATNLASFDRYCGIMFLTGILLLCWLVRDMICHISQKQIMIIASVLVTLLIFHSKAESIGYYTSRQLVYSSINYRQGVNTLAYKINESTPDDSYILLVGNDEDSSFHSMLATLAKPRAFTYSDIYFSAALDESGTGLSVNDMKEILASNYDYVAVYSVTDNLLNNYAGLFEDTSDLADLMLYGVNKETGSLYLVE